MSDLKWLHADDNEQCEWAIDYLFKKRMLEDAVQRRLSDIPFSTITPYEKIEVAISKITDDEKRITFIETMYGAWRKNKTDAKSRKKKEVKSRNYKLTTQSISALKKLSKIHRCLPSQTIELLIKRGFEYEKAARKAELYTEKNLKKRRPREVAKLNEKLKVAEEALKKHKQETDDKIKKLTQMMDKQLKMQCDYYVLLDGYGVLSEPLSDDLKQQSIKKFTELKKSTGIMPD